MSRVIMLEPVPRNIDVRRATEYGKIVQLFSDGDPRATFWDEAFKVQLLAKLEDIEYEPMQDYWLVAGQMAPMAVALTTLVAAYGPVRLLLYHSVEREYWQKIVGDTTHVES